MLKIPGRSLSTSKSASAPGVPMKLAETSQFNILKILTVPDKMRILQMRNRQLDSNTRRQRDKLDSYLQIFYIKSFCFIMTKTLLFTNAYRAELIIFKYIRIIDLLNCTTQRLANRSKNPTTYKWDKLHLKSCCFYTSLPTPVPRYLRFDCLVSTGEIESRLEQHALSLKPFKYKVVKAMLVISASASAHAPRSSILLAANWDAFRRKTVPNHT